MFESRQSPKVLMPNPMGTLWDLRICHVSELFLSELVHCAHICTDNFVILLSVIIKGLNSKSQTTDGLPYIFLDLDCGSKIEARKTVVE